MSMGIRNEMTYIFCKTSEQLRNIAEELGNEVH